MRAERERAGQASSISRSPHSCPGSHIAAMLSNSPVCGWSFVIPIVKDAVSKTTMKVIYVRDYGQARMNLGASQDGGM